jgi:hypothetical protein
VFAITNGGRATLKMLCRKTKKQSVNQERNTRVFKLFKAHCAATINAKIAIANIFNAQRTQAQLFK